ncbi:hypothetical protein G3436_26475, partial [Pseudomonas sp. MAFF212427]
YVPIAGSADEPYFYLLHWQSREVQTHLYVTSTARGFLLQIDTTELAGRSALAQTLQAHFGFVVEGKYLEAHCTRDTVEQRLLSLAVALPA